MASPASASHTHPTSAKNIFVVGLDDFNHQELKTLHQSNEFKFHPLLRFDELEQAEGGSFDALMQQATKQLDAFDGSIDGIIAFWDFPAEAMAPLLCKHYGIAAPSIESVEKCEHKYWSRVEQKKAIPDMVPDFKLVNPFNKTDAKAPLPFPFWLKPVKSFSSYLGFRVNNEKEYAEALEQIREHIGDIAEPYNELLAQVDLPPEMQGIDGTHCIAEAIISGELFSLEGYAQKGEVHIYGVIDTLRTGNESTLSQLQYPSQLPQAVQTQAIEATKKVMQQFDYNDGAFNVEFFYNEEEEQLWLLEINPRISQSHCELFRQVNGDTHQIVPIDIRLGNTPRLPKAKGPFKLAAKYYIRHGENAMVKRVPSQQDITALNKRFPEVRFKAVVEEGKKLSDKLVQDSYSFEIGNLYLGANSEEELQKKLATCLDMLPYEFEPIK